MDVILNVAFGTDVDIQNKPENDYFKYAEEMFQRPTPSDMLFNLARNMFSFKNELSALF